jgi:hypothetical protein
MSSAVQLVLILLEPVVPWVHPLEGGITVVIEQMQHAARAPAAGATLGIAADGAVLVEETQGLLQHGLRKAQLGVRLAEAMHQGGGIAVLLEQALEDPAHRQLQTQVLNRRLLKEGANPPQP